MKATRSRMLDNLGADIIGDEENIAEIGRLAFVPKGFMVVPNESREAANKPQSDKMIMVEEDKGQAVEVLDDSKVHLLAI